MSWWSRIANVFRAERVDRDLDDELQFHIHERIRELTAKGVSPQDAARQAARRFGSALRVREASRDVKLLAWLDALLRDLRLGVRMLRKHALVTATAIVSLSLALGACVAAFALVDALILRPLPVREPGRLVYLTFATNAPDRPEAETFNDPLFLRLRDAGRGRVALFAMSTQVMRPAIFDSSETKELVRTQYVSGDAFDQLGIGAAAGRVIAVSDDARTIEPVAVISHAFWTRRFGGDPAVIGRAFTLEGRPLHIVGVADRRFRGIEPGRPTDVWMPYAAYNPRAFGNAQFNWFRIFGRVETDAPRDVVRSVLQGAFTSFRRDRIGPPGPGRSPEEIARAIQAPIFLRSAQAGPSPLRQQFERPLWILAAIALLVLLVAGSNVANLCLARTAARSREMALRVSIGATRRRLVQQLLIESLLIAIAALLGGWFFARLAAPAVVAMLTSPGDPVQLDLEFGPKLLGIGAGLTVVLTAMFGLVPALRASATAPIVTLNSTGDRAVTRPAMMRPFVIAQVAFGLMVLFVGSLLVLSFARLSATAPGFATSDVLVLSLDSTRVGAAADQRASLLALTDRLQSVPGVQYAGLSEFNALNRAWTRLVALPGSQHEAVEATIDPVSAGYFEAMRIPVRGGRPFEPRDMAGASVVVVNETFASRYFGQSSAVGRMLDIQFDDGGARSHAIVGVVGDTRHDLRQPAAPVIYIPLRNNGDINVRVSGDPVVLDAQVRDAVRAFDARFRVISVTTESNVVARTVLRERLLALLAGFFAVVGLVLVAVGLYGVLSDTVGRRTREIGVRIALGARPGRIVSTVVIDTALTVLVGVVLGLAGGLYLSRFVETLLFEITAFEPESVAVPLALLAVAVLGAAGWPAVRASRVDLIVALRHD